MQNANEKKFKNVMLKLIATSVGWITNLKKAFSKG
jgi:hypothetical protein